MVRKILIPFKCRHCGTIGKQYLGSNVRAKAIEDVKQKIRFHGQLSISKIRAYLFYNYGLGFDDADILVKEMVKVGIIRPVRFGKFEVV